MSFIVHAIILIVVNGFGIWLAESLVPGFDFSGDIYNLVIIGALIGLINALVKPVLKLLALPLILLTLGLFSLVINMLLLFAVDSLVKELMISTPSALLFGTLILLLVNMVASPLIKK